MLLCDQTGHCYVQYPYCLTFHSAATLVEFLIAYCALLYPILCVLGDCTKNIVLICFSFV